MTFSVLRSTALILMASFMSSETFGGDNPAERYLNAYKAYEDAACPIPADDIRHFVYFARDWDAVRDHALLSSERFAGAQIMYTWRELEPEKGLYDFTAIRRDYEYLAKHGKKLFVQLQDVSFYASNMPTPDYLRSPEYDGGVIETYNDDHVHEGWATKRWNPEVRKRFALLLAALGKEFDGRVEGVNLQESAIGVSSETDPTFSPDIYSDALKQNMLALKTAFPRSVTMQYANFMPGEWLPWEDEGYLRGIYAYGEEIGVGLGGPDLIPQRKAQLNHTLAVMHENNFTVPLGIAIQDGNYLGKTGNNDVEADRQSLVPMLHAFAEDFLHIDYMFWVNQQPYFDEDVLPCFEGQ